MAGKVISFINMKGGVGKTTLSLGVADYLSEIGNKVLIIDADPQFNTTQALLDEYKKEGYSDVDSEENYYNNIILPSKKTIFKLFSPKIDMSQSYSTPKEFELIENLKENLDVICGDLNLVLVNNSSDHSFANRIRNFIYDNKLKDMYEYIIIDCPPTLTIYTDSALIASDYYLIPNRIDRYSIVGIESLQCAVENLIKEERINLKCLGLVYTMVKRSMPKKQERIKENFESKKAVGDIDIFSATFTEYNTVQYGVSGTIPTKYKNSKEDIQAISLEIIGRIEADNEEASNE
ncbi:MAG: AAA family ATPase [Anaerostipes sp.]|nr:AAA family ATPase [Anaerostipes sp.]MDD3747662.1 AAA family ATPase [Anaerostipes sp.]